MFNARDAYPDRHGERSTAGHLKTATPNYCFVGDAVFAIFDWALAALSRSLALKNCSQAFSYRLALSLVKYSWLS